MNKEQIIDTWHINNRIDLYLLDSIDEANLSDALTSKGRNVAEQFAHIHNVRLMWLKAAMPGLLEAVTKIEKDAAITKEMIKTNLTASADAIAKLIENACDTGGRVKGFKPHVTGFLGYMLAHDAHHRSQIILALKQSGHKVDQKTGYGIWEWGSR
jgi:uncharacterized damage-inducible protein DinB